MRKNIITSIMILFCAILGTFPHTQALAKAELVTGEKAEKLLKTLEWSHWNPQGGKKDGKHIYVWAKAPT